MISEEAHQFLNDEVKNKYNFTLNTYLCIKIVVVTVIAVAVAAVVIKASISEKLVARLVCGIHHRLTSCLPHALGFLSVWRPSKRENDKIPLVYWSGCSGTATWTVDRNKKRRVEESHLPYQSSFSCCIRDGQLWFDNPLTAARRGLESARKLSRPALQPRSPLPNSPWAESFDSFGEWDKR